MKDGECKDSVVKKVMSEEWKRLSQEQSGLPTLSNNEDSDSMEVLTNLDNRMW